MAIVAYPERDRNRRAQTVTIAASPACTLGLTEAGTVFFITLRCDVRHGLLEGFLP